MGLIRCCSAYALSLINVVLLFLSFPFLLLGWLMQVSTISPCQPLIYKPLITIGSLLLFIAILGIIGACCRLNLLLWIYLCVLFIIILGLAFLLIWGLIYVKIGPGQEVEGEGYKEYKLDDFPFWLKDKLVAGEEWDRIKACMVRHDACGTLETYRAVVDIANMKRTKRTPIEIGCCKPLAECGFELMNDVDWKLPSGKDLASRDPDCKAWSNKDDIQCYNCESCKAGYLVLFVKYWNMLSVFNLIVLIILLGVSVIALCTLK